MLHFRKKKGGAEIHLSKGVDKPSAGQKGPAKWLSNEDVHGFVVFTLLPRIDFSHSKVALRGVVTTKTDDRPDALQRSWRTETFPFFGVALDSKPRPGFKTDDGVVKIPFRFNLEDVQSKNRSCVVADLPPSVSSKDDGVNWTSLRKNELEGQYDVTYTISASIFSKKGLEASTTKTVSVLPVSEAQPPLPLCDFPREYFFAVSTPLQSRVSFVTASSFKLELAAQEPEAIVLSPHESVSNGTTKVSFVAKALPRPSTTFDPSSLPAQCQLKARLVSKTLITPDRVEEKAALSLEQAKHGQHSGVSIHKSDEQESTVAMPRWDHIAPNSAEQFALTKFSFYFSLTGDKAPVPTFFTPILSRRYALDITISFPGNSAPSLKLSLPLQIAYGVDEDCIKPI